MQVSKTMAPLRKLPHMCETCSSDSKLDHTICECCHEQDNLEELERKITEDFKNAMDKKARELQALRDFHKEKHTQYILSKRQIQRELSEKRSLLNSKRIQLQNKTQAFNDALSEVMEMIDSGPAVLPAKPSNPGKTIQVFLLKELKAAIDKLEALVKEPVQEVPKQNAVQNEVKEDIEKKIQDKQEMNRVLRDELKKLELALEDDIPEMCEPLRLICSEVPCQDCSQDPAVAQKEIDVHNKINSLCQDYESKHTVVEEKRSVLDTLPPSMVQNLEALFGGRTPKDSN